MTVYDLMQILVGCPNDAQIRLDAEGYPLVKSVVLSNEFDVETDAEDAPPPNTVLLRVED
jgi:hypothetical protein